jgi:hypothetical protein
VYSPEQSVQILNVNLKELSNKQEEKTDRKLKQNAEN